MFVTFLGLTKPDNYDHIHYLSGHVTKVVRYTIKDTIEYIRSCSMSPDIIVCHSLTNELTKIPPDSCVQHVETQNYYFPMHIPTI